MHRVAQPEPRDDVGRDLRRGRRRRGDDRLRAEPARGVGEPEVVGPEVVAPLRDAVRLVDDEQADPGRAQLLDEPRRGEALRRDVEQPQVAAHRRVERRAVGRGVLLGVDHRDAARGDGARRHRPGRPSATPAARPRPSDRCASAPAAGSTATCPSRSASPRARRGWRAPPRPPPAARAGRPGSRTAPPARPPDRSRARPAAAAPARGRGGSAWAATWRRSTIPAPPEVRPRRAGPDAATPGAARGG